MHDGLVRMKQLLFFLERFFGLKCLLTCGLIFTDEMFTNPQSPHGSPYTNCLRPLSNANEFFIFCIIWQLQCQYIGYTWFVHHFCVNVSYVKMPTCNFVIQWINIPYSLKFLIGGYEKQALLEKWYSFT